MKEGAQDFRSGQEFDHTVFFGENVDIHHIFPQDWCKTHRIKPDVFDSIINKTPLSYRTNRIIGGVAPSQYIAKLEKGNEATPAIASGKLDAYLRSHLIDPVLLRSDNFAAFMEDRQLRLLALIEQATGKPVYTGSVAEEGEDVEVDDDRAEGRFDDRSRIVSLGRLEREVYEQFSGSQNGNRFRPAFPEGLLSCLAWG